MIYVLDTFVNLALNLAGVTGLTDPHQILIAVVLGTAAVLWNSTLLPRWVVSAFFMLVFLASAVAVYALVLGRQPTCLYSYDAGKPVIADSHARKLTWPEVRNLDCPTLWVARNEIFLRSGYCFFTPIAYSYFGNDATCDPNIEKPATLVGEENARIIGRMEARKGCDKPLQTCRKLGRVASSRLLLSRPTTIEER